MKQAGIDIKNLGIDNRFKQRLQNTADTQSLAWAIAENANLFPAVRAATVGVSKLYPCWFVDIISRIRIIWKV